MRYPIIILSGTDFEYHTCDTMNEFIKAVYAECRKFIGSMASWDSGAETKFANKEEAAKYLLADCLLNENFEDICQFIKMRQPLPYDGSFTDDLFD